MERYFSGMKKAVTLTKSPKKLAVSVYFPRELMSKIDSRAKAQYLSRSGYLVALIMADLKASGHE